MGRAGKKGFLATQRMQRRFRFPPYGSGRNSITTAPPFFAPPPVAICNETIVSGKRPPPHPGAKRQVFGRRRGGRTFFVRLFFACGLLPPGRRWLGVQSYEEILDPREEGVGGETSNCFFEIGIIRPFLPRLFPPFLTEREGISQPGY